MTQRRPLLGGLLILCLAVLAASCGDFASPQGWASPTVEDSTAYVFRDRQRLSAISIENQSAAVQWEFPNRDERAHRDIKIEAVYGDPIIDGDRLYFAGYDGDVFALERATGRLIWRVTGIHGSIAGGPTLSDGHLVFGTTEGRVYVISADFGEPVPGWTRDGVNLSDDIWAAPVVHEGIVYVATMRGRVHALRIEDGAAAWPEAFKAGGAIPELTLINGDTLFVPSFDKRVYLLDVATGRPRFDGGFQANHWVWNRPAVQGNIAYFGDLDGFVYALDITTNQLVWATLYETHSKVKAAPVISGDMLVVVDRKPEVHFLALADGQPMGVAPIVDAGSVRADPVDSDSGLLVITTKGRLFRVDPGLRTVFELQVGARPQ